ncbi:MAG TPA: pepsin-like aspartic protease [Kofleriaceae bacterium]|jgi:predicted aspartyl protease
MFRRWLVIILVGGACSGDAPDVPHLDWPSSTAVALVHVPGGYAANAQIGSQTFAMLVDTGSTTTAVADASCSECSQIVSPLYTPGGSAKDTGHHATATYADGTQWTGEIYVDQVGLGSGSPAVPLELAAITVEIFFFKDNTTQGILGLGTPETLLDDTTSYPQTVTESDGPSQLAFELCGSAGTMWLGDYDTTAAASAPMFTPLIAPTDSAPYYDVAIDDIGLGGTSLGFGASTYATAFVDTGTTDLVIPTEAYDAFIAAVDALPAMTTLFPGQTFTPSVAQSCIDIGAVTDAQLDAMLPALTMSFPASSGTFTVMAPPTRSYLDDSGTGQLCLGVGDGGSGDSATTVLGNAFMRGFVTVIDAAHSQVGFAPAAGCGSDVSSALGRRRAPRRRGPSR